MPIPESALLLAGFVLAHAAWSISDTPDLLVPLAIVERGGKRQLNRFEASTQEEAIAHGKEAMTALSADADDWVFAREGLMDVKGNVSSMLSALILGSKAARNASP